MTAGLTRPLLWRCLTAEKPAARQGWTEMGNKPC
jgi:hypothetical protein